MHLSTETLLLALAVAVLLGGVSSYYFGRRRGKQHPNHLIGVIVTVIVIAVVVRLLGIHY